jgi:hypothetical protein
MAVDPRPLALIAAMGSGLTIMEKVLVNMGTRRRQRTKAIQRLGECGAAIQKTLTPESTQ